MLNIYCWSCGSQIKEKDVLGMGRFDQNIGKYKGKGFITFKCSSCKKVRYQIVNKSLLLKQKKYIKRKSGATGSNFLEKEEIDINHVIDFFETLNDIETVDNFLSNCRKETGNTSESNKDKKLKAINQPLDVYNFYNEFSNLDKKRLMILTLDENNLPVTWEFMGEGLENKINFHPKAIYHKSFLLNKKVSIIIAENKKGDFEIPEEKDLVNLKRLVKSGAILGIKLLDYIVIDDNDFYSYDDLNLI